MRLKPDDNSPERHPAVNLWAKACLSASEVRWPPRCCLSAGPTIVGEGLSRSGRRAEAHQAASPVVVELAGLAPVRRAHRDDEFGDLLGCIERPRILARHQGRTHAGADRARIEQVDA